MTSADAKDHEMQGGARVPAAAVAAAVRGDVVYLTQNGRRVAAIVPPEVAIAGHAAITALQDDADLQVVQERRASIAAGEKLVPLDEVLERLETAAGDEYRAEAAEIAEVDVEVKEAAQ